MKSSFYFCLCGYSGPGGRVVRLPLRWWLYTCSYNTPLSRNPVKRGDSTYMRGRQYLAPSLTLTLVLTLASSLFTDYYATGFNKTTTIIIIIVANSISRTMNVSYLKSRREDHSQQKNRLHLATRTVVVFSLDCCPALIRAHACARMRTAPYLI